MEALLDAAGEKVVGNCEKSGENWEQVWITLPKIEGNRHCISALQKVRLILQSLRSDRSVSIH